MMGRGRGRGRGGGGRGDSGLRFASGEKEPRRSSGWGVAPPSRHLWVGSLGPGVTRAALSELFLRFGEVEDIAHAPGRSFAFVNFRKEEDATMALQGLQGALVAGAPIRIEFSKGDRASGVPMVEGHPQNSDERRFVERGRDLRTQYPSPEKSNDKSKRNRSTEPSEVLWIGFPAALNVDEATLRKAFSPFGDIDKITTFPGRSYAFVQYTTIAAAYRAKEALQGKLFDNPRVSICFARSEGTATEVGRSSSVVPYSPHFNPSFQTGFGEQDFEALPRGRPFDSPRDFRMASPRFGPDFERLPRDVNDMGFVRTSSFRPGPGIGPGPICNFEPVRKQGLGPERRMSEDLYEQHRSSPAMERGAPWHDIPFERPRRPLPLEHSWGVEDSSYPLLKKLRTDQVPDKELPEYPFSESDQGKHDPSFSKFYPGLQEDGPYHRNSHPIPLGDKNVPDLLRNPIPPLADRNEPWRATDSFGTGSAKLHRSNPEPHQPLLKGEWRWEGMIAKGGTPICRARCFPVGKVLDFMLPELLNCTARTSLGMLAKHYYQAASSWVVFFVPETDADMTFYNEFMNYLGEKQRAAVCKLGERTTLFLVPPSEFSEQVLRVPGKVSISGVILKFQQLSSDLSSLHHSLEVPDKMPPSFASHLNTNASSHEDPAAFRRLDLPDIRALPQVPNYLSSSSGNFTPISTGFLPPHKLDGNPPYPGSLFPRERPPPDSHREIAQDEYQQQSSALPLSWSSNMHIPSPGAGHFSSLAQSAVSHTSDSTEMTYSFTNQRVPQGTPSGNVATEASTDMSLPAMKLPSQQEVRPRQPSSLAVPLQSDQLAQLATLLAQQKQPGKEPVLPVDSLNKQSSFLQNLNLQGHASLMDGPGAIPHALNSLPPVPPSAPPFPVSMPQIPASVAPIPTPTPPPNASMPSRATVPLPSMHVSVTPARSSVPSSSFVPPLPQGPPFQQHMSHAPPVQPVVGSGQQTSQQASTHEEPDGDPQKRLQATLQLAAALLQQIQQQSKTGGQQ